MKKLKYIFCDMDGTLLNDKWKISKEQAVYLCDLCRRKQIRFGFASGREVTSLIPIAEEMGILEICDVMVVNNGADIYDVKRKMKMGVQKIEVQDVYAILEMIRPYEWLNAVFHNHKGFFALYDTPHVRRIMENNHYDCCHSPVFERFEAVSRLSLLFEPERMEDVRRIMTEIEIPSYIKGVQSDKNVYDFLRSGVCKGKGIQAYVSSCGDTMEDVIVFGDEENDIEMMQMAGVSVAMKNATKRIQEKASYVTEKTNNEDGIMHFLKKVEEWF